MYFQEDRVWMPLMAFLAASSLLFAASTLFAIVQA